MELFPSEFAANFMYMPSQGQLENFSFVGREFWLPIYDTKSPRVLLKCGRQVEKSTSLGNVLLAYTSLMYWFKSLFITPTQQQTEVFSKDRISSPIKMSHRLQTLAKGRDTVDNVLFKRFVTDSEITLRYAFLNADRARGIMADLVAIDEIQDILTEVIPVIEECLFTSNFQMMRYSGTPKSVDNTLSVYWHERSTQNEWAIPCDCTGSKPHWNIIGLKHIGKEGLICDKCGKTLYARHPDAQWVSMRSSEWLRDPPESVGIPFEGFRIPQVISPRVVWAGVLDKRARYSAAQFHNETLGLEFDSADKLLTKEMIQANCLGSSMKNSKNFAGRAPMYMGIDWEGGGTDAATKAYTVVSIGGYLGGRFTYVYFERFFGERARIDKLIPELVRLVHEHKVSLVGTDYGGGLDKNDELIRELGIRRVLRYQYVNTKRIYFDRGLMRWMVNRAEALMVMVNALRRGDTFSLPPWEEFETPFGGDLLSLFQEYNESRRTTVINKTPGTTDDTMHSMLYCFLASMAQHPRPDLLTPDQDR